MAFQVEGDGNVLRVIRVMRPRRPNSVCLNLDGPEDQVFLNYIHCQEEYRSWNNELAIVRGNNVSKVFTTPTGSTFYYAINYKENFLVFIIEGRKGWLHGYYAVTSIDGNLQVKGIHEFKSVESYINHDRCVPLPFEGNHNDISRTGCIADTLIGLKALRDAFDTILAYNVGAKYEDVKAAFGTIVVHICESLKLQPVFDRICEVFVNPDVKKLGKGGDISIPDSITKWTKLSRHGMRVIENPDYKIHINEFPNISSEQHILILLRVLNVDAYFGGPFKHDVATNPCHWEPLEPGTNVPSVDIPFLEEHTSDERGGEDRDGGKDRDQQNGGQSGGKQKREGDGKGRHHGQHKGKRGGGNRERGQQGGGGRGRQRGGVSLSASGFPGGWSGGQGKELSMDQNPIGFVMQPKDLVCMYMLMCKPPVMSLVEESKYPWCQLIKNYSLTSLPFYMTNQQQGLGTAVMTRGGDRPSWTEAQKLIGTALLGLEEWYLIGWG